MKFLPLASRLENILAREVSLQQRHLRLVGSSSTTALAMLLSNSFAKNINGLPHLVVCSSSADAERLRVAIQFFDPQRSVEILPHFDVSPYSGLFPKPQAVAERLRFLYRAMNAKPLDIFIAPIGSLLQRCLPFTALQQNCLKFKLDDDVPSDITSVLLRLGYQSAPIVEDVGHFARRGGILDIFSPAHSSPIRIELFGDTIVSLREFDPQTQTSKESEKNPTKFTLIPARETLWLEDNAETMLEKFRASVQSREVDRAEFEETLRSLSRQTSVDGLDFLLPFFFPKLDTPLDLFPTGLNLWLVDPGDLRRHADDIFAELQSDYATSTRQVIRPPLEDLFTPYEKLPWPEDSRWLEWSSLEVNEMLSTDVSDMQKRFGASKTVEYRSFQVLDLVNVLSSNSPGGEAWLQHLQIKFNHWQEDGYRIVLGLRNKTQAERLRLFLEKIDWQSRLHEADSVSWGEWIEPESASKKPKRCVEVVLRLLPESVRLPEEKIIFLRDEDLFGRKTRMASQSSSAAFQDQARRLSFGDLKPGDCVVHTKHGVGVYEGLRVMNIGGVDSEFIQVQYKDNDKLYLPVYRVGQLQKYSGAAQTTVLDRLGGTGWEKTKTKVRGHLRDIASELLSLYAKRAELVRGAFQLDEDKYAAFSTGFPYDETDDQLRSINDVLNDLTGPKPMDRLICGDVGYGKTEVAMRAAFVAASNKKQVVVLAPTTVLSFQHYENFRKRFAGWPIEIRELNRFVSAADVKKTIQEFRAGKVDILIGTHRVLSKDVEFKNLGLLIVDEEQKFGVAHKERVKKLRTEVDTLTMSATPIPRTLNMSLVGIRDLSLINTAPVDRLPTRTFISKWDPETIRKSILSEIKRGGQVYFIHNRVQSIFGVADELRQIVPEARIKVGHGQMDEEELEKTMIQFFNHEIDVLLCTTIVESGMDIPRANTMFIDQAHIMGLSQLYQLRGRVGRSKQRAYCYLLLPRNRQIEKDAQERLKVIQENTALGSGIRIAQYDLELRGTGNILGEEQSGHVNSVGYEMYMDLLNEAVHELRGDPLDTDAVDPEINLRVPALIPDNYIGDIRLRLSFYKALAEVRSIEDVERIEGELKDQFGEPPEATQNLMGLMLIRSQCKELYVRDLSAGVKTISLVFTEKTPLKTDIVIGLAMRQNKKYSVTPDNRLNIRMNTITWPAVYEELNYLLSLK